MAAPSTTLLGLPLGTRPAGTPVTPALTGTSRIWALGDSLTDGTGGTTGWAWREHAGWMLNDAGISWTSVGNIGSASTQWQNHRGLFGWTIQDHIDDWSANPTRVSTADPDIVCILPLGNNDCADDAGLAAAPGRMTALLETLRAYTNGRGVKPRIVACYLFGHGNDAAKNARHDSLNTSLASTVWPAQQALGQSITICDPRPFIKVPLNNGMRSDYTHPTDAGYRRLADCYFPAICNALGVNAQWGRSSS